MEVFQYAKCTAGLGFSVRSWKPLATEKLLGPCASNAGAGVTIAEIDSDVMKAIGVDYYEVLVASARIVTWGSREVAELHA
jgi:hypothetical protein